MRYAFLLVFGVACRLETAAPPDAAPPAPPILTEVYLEAEYTGTDAEGIGCSFIGTRTTLNIVDLHKNPYIADEVPISCDPAAIEENVMYVLCKRHVTVYFRGAPIYTYWDTFHTLLRGQNYIYNKGEFLWDVDGESLVFHCRHSFMVDVIDQQFEDL